MSLAKMKLAAVFISYVQADFVNATANDGCNSAYAPLVTCPPGSNQGSSQTNWSVTSSKKCVGPCDSYSTFQWTSKTNVANNAIEGRNGGSLISSRHGIPRTLDELRCWFLPEFSWGMQNPGVAPPWNPQPEAAYLDDAGNGLGGGLPGPDAKVACCCQEECTMEMIELRHFIYQAPGCRNMDIDYNTDGDNGRVLLTKTSDRQGQLPNTKHEACMCGDRTPQNQLPFYYYVVKGPEKDNSDTKLQLWLNSLRTAYNQLFDIWAQSPPCSGECLIMGGASDAWENFGHSTARSVYYQLRAFAAFDPHALPSACGPKGVMLRFGGMTLEDDGTVTCNGVNNWGATGANCRTMTKVRSNFQQLVTQSEDDDFFAQAGGPGAMVLETDVAIVTIDSEFGVEVKKKSSSCSQPTLDYHWRCNGRGGVSDNATCNREKPGPPGPPTPAPPPPSWQPCKQSKICCTPHTSPPQYCPGAILCGDCGAAACSCPSSESVLV